MKGYGWAAGSILLASVAQLLMKWGVGELPSIFSFNLELLVSLSEHLAATVAVSCGLLFYAISMLCWFFTLRDLPLSKAYPLLSISYGVVYAGATLLPWFNEPLSFIKTLGVTLIICGVWIINCPRVAKI